MKEIKVAICGCVGHVERFGGLVNSCPESEIVAVWDYLPERGQKVAQALNCRFEPDFDAIIADSTIHGITINTPNYMHADMAIKAARAGKHIFVEKPVSVTLEEAVRVREEVKKSGVKFFMSDPFVNSSNQYIKKFIDDGKLGKLISVHVRMYNYADTVVVPDEKELVYRRDEMGGGVMSDTGNHPLHALHYILGTPEKVHSMFSYKTPGAKEHGIEQYACVMMEYPDGVAGIIEACLTAPGFSNLATYVGTEGVIVDRAVGSSSKDIAYRLNGQDDWTTITHEELMPETFDHIVFWIRMIADDLDNDCVGIDPRSTHGVGIDDAVEYLKIKEAIYEACTKGTPVKQI